MWQKNAFKKCKYATDLSGLPELSPPIPDTVAQIKTAVKHNFK